MITVKAGRARRLGLERLEGREMLSAGGWGDVERVDLAEVCVEPIQSSVSVGIPFEFEVSDQLAKDYPLMESNLDVAGEILSSVMGGKGQIEVTVRISASMPFPTAAAVIRTVPGTIVDAEGKTVNVEMPATLSEANTGVDSNGQQPDVIVEIHPDFLKNTLWFDPSGSLRSAPVPTDKIDFISTVLHEVVHGLGINGLRRMGGSDHAQFINGQRSSFDALTDWSEDRFGLMVFNGPEATSVYGEPVPLTSYMSKHDNVAANFYHLGDQFHGKDLLDDLMSGIPSSQGVRRDISQVDLAISHDIGWKGPQRVPVRPIIEFDWSQFYVLPEVGPPEPPIEDIDLPRYDVLPYGEPSGGDRVEPSRIAARDFIFEIY